MRTQAGPIGPQDVSAYDAAAALGDIGASAVSEPVGQCLIAGRLRLEDVRIPAGDDRMEDLPDGFPVVPRRFANNDLI